jgi:hypothetical protein
MHVLMAELEVKYERQRRSELEESNPAPEEEDPIIEEK